MKKNIVILILCLSISAVTVHVVSAHGDEVHTDDNESTASVSEAELARMEQLVKLLQELVTLMSALKIQQSYAPVAAVPTHTTTDDTASEDAEMDTHHEEHSTADSESDATEAQSALIIEVEKHNERTHVHARYIDKPEEMFFVDASMDDEDALIEDIHEYTGLDTETIRAALKYYR